MEQLNQQLIDTLNNLIEVNTHRCAGYEFAAKEVEDEKLRNLFQEIADQSYVFKNELWKKVIALKGRPTEKISLTGEFFNAWNGIKSAIAIKDDTTIADAFELAELVTSTIYRDALHSPSLTSGELRNLILDERLKIGNTFTRIKAFRHAFSV